MELSKEVIEEVKRLLPEIRTRVENEMKKFDVTPGKPFYSDKAILATLPHAAYEYIILSWGVSPEHIDKTNLHHAINSKLINHMPKVLAHALRKVCAAKSEAGVKAVK